MLTLTVLIKSNVLKKTEDSIVVVVVVVVVVAVMNSLNFTAASRTVSSYINLKK